MENQTVNIFLKIELLESIGGVSLDVDVAIRRFISSWLRKT